MRCHYFDGIAATLSDERKIANLPALIQDKLLQSDFIVPLFFTRYSPHHCRTFNAASSGIRSGDTL